MLTSITEFPKDSFTENVAAALVGKEGWPVEIVSIGATKTTIQILAAGIYIGVIYERLEGSGAYLCHTRGPIRKSVAAQAMNVTNLPPIYVKQSATGLVPANSGDKSCGLLMSSASGAGSMVNFMAFDCIMP
jgi:hypothetical protein